MPEAQVPSGTEGDDTPLGGRIRATRGRASAVKTVLKTDERVLARITDGIYRQPGSALRELISNAYDADATRVVITTDRPRFERITIEDDGRGMTADALANMLEHIGGSAKRSAKGAALGVTNAENASLSPGGRRLIGKIGIGLFSVAQLTQRFQIITKVAGESVRTVASVTLKHYDDADAAATDGEVEAGLVSVWQESAEADPESHGTTIVLNQILPKTRQTLQSAGEWLRYDSEQAPSPRYHIGRHRLDTVSDLYTFDGSVRNVPWDLSSDPRDAFGALVDVVWEELNRGRTNPKVDQLFDYYLQMVWQLAISAPLPYIGSDPWNAFRSGQVSQLTGVLPSGVAPLGDSERDRWERYSAEPGAWGTSPTEFRVVVDDLELRRPIRFSSLPSTSHALTEPLFYVGHLREEFDGIDRSLSGGPLEFYAYFMWAPKIAPIDHLGTLIRVHGASGTQFDSTFLKYQVAEIARLRQITCEVFVTEGFESALNIDRESFNAAHPHAVRLTSWVHAALGKVINHEKALANTVRRETRRDAADAEVRAIQSVVRATWERVTNSQDDIPVVAFSDQSTRAGTVDILYPRARTMGSMASRTSREAKTHEVQLAALVQLLAAYGFLNELTSAEQDDLVRDLSWVLRGGEG